MNSEDPAAGAVPGPRPALRPALVPAAVSAGQGAALEGLVLDPVTARKRARDEAFRATPEAAMFRAFSGG